jgi:hypothetical protein
LGIIQLLNLKETWKSIRAIVVSVGEYLSLRMRQVCEAFFELTKHFGAGFPRPLTDNKRQEQVRMPLQCCVDVDATFLSCSWAVGLNFFLFFNRCPD